MALGDSRRASGLSMEEQRRAIGKNNQDSRRAIGKANEDSRRGTAQLVDDLNRLTVPTKEPRRLRTVQPRGSLPATRGTATNAPKPIASTGGGGIASPLTEPDYSVREFWAEGIVSSDGLFFMPAVKKIVMQDANGESATFEYAQPVSP